MGGDDELRVGVVAQGVVKQDEERELALGGECGFGLVEEEEAVAGEFVFEEGEEGFAVRAGVEALPAVAREDRRTEELFVQFVDVGGGVEEAFGAEEEACAGSFIEGEAKGADQGVG